MSYHHRPQVVQFKGDHSSKFLKTLLEKPINWDGQVIIDCREVTFATPILTIVVAVAKGRGWDFRNSRSSNVNRYLDWVINGSYSDSHRYIPVKWPKTPKAARNIANEFKAILSKWVSQSVLSDLRYAFSELMDNVFDHANSSMGFCVNAQKYPILGRVEIVVADFGRGIANSMLDNPAYAGLNDLDRFEKALKLGVSSKPDEHTGEGLSSILEWMHDNIFQVEGAILSHNHIWCILEGEIGISKHPFQSWPGTFIWLAIPYHVGISINDSWSKRGLVAD